MATCTVCNGAGTTTQLTTGPDGKPKLETVTCPNCGGSGKQ